MICIKLIGPALVLIFLFTSVGQDCDWTGTWNTEFGQMMLQQSGNTVTGTYGSSGGQLHGNLSGNDLIGNWNENGFGSGGTFNFTMADSCNSFNGQWQYYGGTGIWTGTRTSGMTQTPTQTPASSQAPTSTYNPTSTQNPTSDLTGVWNCDDGGIYYIRQTGSTIWWYGEQTATNPQFSNVAKGIISGNTINLDWIDVPKGHTTSGGILALNIISNGQLIAIQKTGGFGGSTWTRQT